MELEQRPKSSSTCTRIAQGPGRACARNWPGGLGGRFGGENSRHEISDMLHFLREHAANEDECSSRCWKRGFPTRRLGSERNTASWSLSWMEWNATGTAFLSDGARPDADTSSIWGTTTSCRIPDHMDREETHLTDLFYRHFSDAEIEGEFKKIIARTTPQDMGMMLSHIASGHEPLGATSVPRQGPRVRTTDVFVK